MLDATALEEKHPDKHFRFVNTSDPGKVQGRVADGYERVSEEDARAAGARSQVGESVLMSIPREKYEERVQRQKEVHDSRLKAHQTEVQRAVEAVARELRDRHGINVPVERLLVDE
jgi:hypothetical protein